MRNLKFLIFILVVLLTACNKYEDGPFFSLRSAKARVCQTWQIESYTVNGIDSLTTFKNHELYCEKYTLKEVDYEAFIEATGCENNSTSSILHGKWSLVDSNKSLYFKLGAFGYPTSHVLEEGLNWRILRLTINEMWLNTNFNNKEYEIHFKTF